MYIHYPLSKEDWQKASNIFRKKYIALIRHQEEVEKINQKIKLAKNAENFENLDSYLKNLEIRKENILTSAKHAITAISIAFIESFYMPREVAEQMAAEYHIPDTEIRGNEDDGEYSIYSHYVPFTRDGVLAEYYDIKWRYWRRSDSEILEEIREFILNYNNAQKIAKEYDMTGVFRRHLYRNFRAYAAGTLRVQIRDLRNRKEEITEKYNRKIRAITNKKKTELRQKHKQLHIPKSEMDRLPYAFDSISDYYEAEKELVAAAEENHRRTFKLASMYKQVFKSIKNDINGSDKFDATFKFVTDKDCLTSGLYRNRNRSVCAFWRFMTKDEYELSYYIFNRINREVRKLAKAEQVWTSVSISRSFEFLRYITKLMPFYMVETSFNRINSCQAAVKHVEAVADYDVDEIAREFHACVEKNNSSAPYAASNRLIDALDAYSKITEYFENDAKTLYSAIFVVCMNYRKNQNLDETENAIYVNNFVSACALLLYAFTKLHSDACRITPLIHKYMRYLEFPANVSTHKPRRTKRKKKYDKEAIALILKDETKEPNPPIHRGCLDYMPAKAFNIIDNTTCDSTAWDMDFDDLIYSTAIRI